MDTPHADRLRAHSYSRTYMAKQREHGRPTPQCNIVDTSVENNNVFNYSTIGDVIINAASSKIYVTILTKRIVGRTG